MEEKENLKKELEKIEFKDFKLIMHGFFKYNVPSQWIYVYVLII